MDAIKAAFAGQHGGMMEGIEIDLSIAENRAVRNGAHIVNSTPLIYHKPGLKSFGRNTRAHER